MLGKVFLIHDDLTCLKRIILAASEFVGTAMLLIVGCMGCVIFSGTTLLSISVCFGVAIMLGVQCMVQVSGGHINPVVTFSAAILGYLPLIDVPVYIIGQLLGAVAGFGVVKATTPSHLMRPIGSSVGVCSPYINKEIKVFQGFLSEFFASLILTLLCCSVWDPRNSTQLETIPIKFGIAIIGLAIAFGPYSGCNINPVRSFAPALWNGDWDNHWVYWVGPLSASIIGSVLYRIIFGVKSSNSSSE